ncbi:MAG: ligase-associated DNA damage response endonuclease PdeM [Alphaproteobacteria bacterium]|nr:ligase-associated DNA damage response endonuclease PdeM [Alphaproteobacteria bacterium]MBU0794140.1 ligase-associated DNA damage response endonuclease PdeM [Alphaproteobacteria bacterium]MBU0876717.1 ligase-associated DNA damage response endonuclease PdeM [Alphaproteobacteria bacterium]MBU1769419.1 ligase-associated DNA damage response endonuclease PdeM [Alphaproteobacteria bacterium]
MSYPAAVDEGILKATPPGPAFSFAGQNWHALPQGALFWRERAALIVADLHFEKASAFARRGQMLPPYDSRATLDALEDVIARTTPREIWCLGDSFHDMGAHDRMMAETRERIVRLTAACRWTWITGNHDPQGGSASDSSLGGESIDEALIDGVLLRHEACPGEARPEISGHFHPKLRINLRGRHIARRCFVMGARKLIVPAFGALTGGLDAASPVITSLVGQEREALIALEDRLLRFALAK